MPVFEEFPYTNFHELNLDWIIQEIKKLKEPGNIEYLEQHRVFDHIRWYIDGVNGSDTNNGSYTAPFKTIDRFLQESKRYSGIRATIISAGTYTVTAGNSFNNIVFMINSSVPDVTIRLLTDSTNVTTFYNCYVRIDGAGDSQKITVEAPPSSGLAYDVITAINSYVRLENVKIPYNRLAIVGGGLLALKSEIHNVLGLNSTLRFNACKIVNTTPDLDAYNFNTCKVAFYGNMSAEELTAASSTGSFLYADSSEIYIHGDILPALTNSYYYGIDANYSYINIPTSVRSNLNSRSVNGNRILSNVDVFEY